MQLSSDQLTLLLNRVVDNPEERDRPIFKQIYQELHRIAARYMARESPRHSLQITGLVHEAYLELVADENRNWQNRAHFFGYAARVMRHILVRHAKQKRQRNAGVGAFAPPWRSWKPKVAT